MYRDIYKYLLVAGMMSLSIISLGQSKSPFTSRGIGQINSNALSHNEAMGGLGLSNGTFWNLNNMNPALLPNNTLTVFAAGLAAEQRIVSNEILEETSTGGSLGYLATAFPIKPGQWTSSIGLAPYSNVNYGFTIRDRISNSSDSVDITESGSGGFSQFYWSNGFKITENFQVGVKATYLFSPIESNFESQLVTEDNQALVPSVQRRTSVSDFIFQAGVAYNKDSIFNNNIKLNLGATYDFGSKVNASLLESANLTQLGRNITTDTLRNDESGSIQLPWKVGAGFSFSNGQKWTAGLDVHYQAWSEYQNFDGESEELNDSYTIILGAELTPDPTSVESYFKRVTYRVGLSYQKTPFVINGEQVNDFGINFGWSLPVSRFSSLDMAFKYGRRGNLSDTLIEEEYFRFVLGVTFNDRWFIKRKYD